MILYRHADPRFPFLWETADQPPARWHGAGEGPVQYLADTPDGAWAELLRHEGITSDAEASNIRRAIWAVEVPDGLHAESPDLPQEVMTGGLSTHEPCRKEARRLRDLGATAIRAGSAALREGAAGGWRVSGGLQPGPSRSGAVFALFGARPDLTGWVVAFESCPPPGLAANVRRLK